MVNNELIIYRTLIYILWIIKKCVSKAIGLAMKVGSTRDLFLFFSRRLDGGDSAEFKFGLRASERLKTAKGLNREPTQTRGYQPRGFGTIETRETVVTSSE